MQKKYANGRTQLYSAVDNGHITDVTQLLIDRSRLSKPWDLSCVETCNSTISSCQIG